MPTLKELLDAYGKASARNGHSMFGTKTAIEVPYNDWDFRYVPPKDGVIIWFVRYCVDVSVVGVYGTTYLYSDAGHGYYGGFCPVKKGDSVTIVYKQTVTTQQHEFSFAPYLYES